MQFENDCDRLKQKGIATFNMTWQHYSRSHDPLATLKFDGVITEPPTAQSRNPFRTNNSSKVEGYEIEKDEQDKFADYCKRILKPATFAVIICPFYMFKSWFDSFQKAGFVVMEEPYVLSKDSSTIPARDVGLFPQSGNMYGVIVRNPGGDSTSFKPSYKSKFIYVNSTNDRRLSAMWNIPQPKSTLKKGKSRVPHNPNELSVNMLCELIDLFVPPSGNLIDPYGGTINTGVASIRTGRACHIVEQNESCFKDAVSRLRKLLPTTICPVTTMASVNLVDTVNESMGSESLNGTSDVEDSENTNDQNISNQKAEGIDPVTEKQYSAVENLMLLAASSTVTEDEIKTDGNENENCQDTLPREKSRSLDNTKSSTSSAPFVAGRRTVSALSQSDVDAIKSGVGDDKVKKARDKKNRATRKRVCFAEPRPSPKKSEK